MFFRSKDRIYRHLPLDLAGERFSALLIRPKPKLLRWIESLAERQRGFESLYRYQAEEDGVYLIPEVRHFVDSYDIQRFVEHIKPWLFEQEFSRFALPRNELPKPTAHEFDEFFDVELRDFPAVVPTKLIDTYARRPPDKPQRSA